MTDALVETATLDSRGRTVPSSPSSVTQVLPDPHEAHIAPATGGAVRSRRRWGAWATTAWLLASFVTAAVVVTLGTSWAGEGNASRIVDVAAKSAMLGVLVLAAYLSRRPVADYLGLIRPRPGHAVEIAIVGLVCLAAGILIWFSLGPALGFRWPTGPQTGATLSISFLMWIRAGFFAPFMEELVFRGFLYRGFSESRLGVAGAIMLTAVLFTAMHLTEYLGTSNWYLDVLRIMLTGLLFGWLRERTGSLLPSLGIHTLVNAVEAPVIEHLLAWH